MPATGPASPVPRPAPPLPTELPGSGRLAGFFTGSLIGTLLSGRSSALGFGDIALVGLLAYVAFRLVARSRETAPLRPGQGRPLPYAPPSAEAAYLVRPQGRTERSQYDAAPRSYHRHDPLAGDPNMTESAVDLFLKVQAAWSSRDVEPIVPLLTPEMQDAFHGECAQMREEGRVNHLEEISVRSAQIVKAWEDRGYDHVIVRFEAMVLDYTTDEKSGNVIQGSRTEPVEFRELWTFTRPVWAKAWRLGGTQAPGPASA